MIVVGLSGAMGAGKTTVTERLVCEHGFHALAFAEPLWAMLECIGVDVERAQHDRAYKDHHVLPGIGRTPRELIQTLGTEWGRYTVHPNLWVILAEQRLHALHQQLGKLERVVFSDVRFDNEAYWIVEKLRGQIWHIARPQASHPHAHTSERGIHTSYISRGICNDGTLERLYARVDRLVEELLSGE